MFTIPEYTLERSSFVLLNSPSPAALHVCESDLDPVMLVSIRRPFFQLSRLMEAEAADADAGLLGTDDMMGASCCSSMDAGGTVAPADAGGTYGVRPEEPGELADAGSAGRL